MKKAQKITALFLSAIVVITATLSINLTAFAKISNLDKILNLVPSTYSFDGKESEYNNVENSFKAYLTEKCQEKNINCSNVHIGLSIDFYDLHKATVYLSDDNESKEKDISVTYSNSNQYNDSDQQYINGLTFKIKHYFEVDFDYMVTGKSSDNKMKNYYLSQINADGFSVSFDSRAGGTEGTLNMSTFDGGTVMYIFKNDIFYRYVKLGDTYDVPVINIPSNVSDAGIEAYVKSLYEKVYGEDDYSYNEFKGLEKGAVYDKQHSVVSIKGNLPDDKDVYTLYSVGKPKDDERPSWSATSYIILRRSQSNNTVKPATANTAKISLTLKKVSVKRSAKKLVLQSTLKINGKVAKGKKVSFKFNGKKYTAKTNKKGIAKVTVKKSVLKKLKKGKKIKYQVTYGKTTIKRTAKVK